jgi:hypothetical protein
MLTMSAGRRRGGDGGVRELTEKKEKEGNRKRGPGGGAGKEAEGKG